MRRVLLVATLFLTSLAFAQAGKWPQPTLHGTIVVWGGDKGKSVAKELFIQLARDKQSILIIDNKTDGATETWKSVTNAKIVEPLAIERVPDGAAIWVERLWLPGSLNVSFDELLRTGAVLGVDENGLSALRLSRMWSLWSLQGDLRDKPLSLDIDDSAVMLVQGRTITVRGEGKVVVTIKAGEKTESVSLVAGIRADVIALERRAIDLAMPEFPPKVAAVPEVKSGSLFIVGGGGMPQGLLQKFIEACGGPDAPIVYVPCEQAEVIPVEPGFVSELKRAGAKNVTWIHTKDRNKSDTDEEFLKPLKEAKGVWFGGGRQWNLVDLYQDTKAHELMREVLKRGGAIGGSSAGASIQAEFLARGDPLGNTNIIAPGYTRGLGFLPGAAVDQHFTQRGRHKDMTLLMKTYPQLLGIGIDEATAIIVRGTTAEVTGRGQVFFYDYRVAPTSEIDYVALKEGERFDLKERKKQ